MINKEQKIIAEGTRAENLLESTDYKLVKTFIKNGTNKIKDVLGRGISNELDDNGNIVRTWQEKYWEYVGKIQSLNSIEIYLKRKIDKKDAIIKKGEAAESKEAKTE